MDGTHDLQLLLVALRSGAVDPIAVSAAGAGWNPVTDGRFVPFLVARGLIPADLADRLEAAVATTVVFSPPPNGAADTPTHLPAVDGAAPHTRPLHDPPPAAGPGTPLPVGPRYRPVRFHRSGGLGEVWVARDALIDREVALKRLRSDRPDTPTNRRRFVREGRVTGQLEHPCIVPLYDLTPEDAAGGPSYVMRFVDGHTLTEVIAGYHMTRKAGAADRLLLAKLLDAFVAVCRAVAFAHDRGVIHRDLKGPNVILGEYGEVFLLDWGLAKRAGDPDPSVGPDSGRIAPDDTPPGSRVGTPAYMAPELAAGEPAGRLTDVYALGGILYAVLTGQPPVDGLTPDEVLQKVRAAAPPPPRAVVPATPPALDAICRKAMARQPADRYESADALAEDVRRWLADEPVAAYPEPWTVRAGRWARRHRTGVTTAAVALALTAAGSAVAAGLIWRAKEETAAAKARADEDHARFRKAAADAFNLVAAAEPYLASNNHLQAFRKAVLLTGTGAYRQLLAADPDDPALRTETAAVFRYTANVHRFEGELTAAEPLYREAVALLERLIADAPGDPRHPVQLAYTLVDEAALRSAIGRQSEVAALLDRAAGLSARVPAAEASAEHRRLTATVALSRAAVAVSRGDYPAARAAAAAAADLYRRLDGGDRDRHSYDPLLLASARITLMTADRRAGQPADAVKTYETAVRPLLRPMLPNPPPMVNQADVVNTVALARQEHARCLSAGHPGRAEAAAMIVTQWGILTRHFPRVLEYPENWAVAARDLGEWGLAGPTAAAAVAGQAVVSPPAVAETWLPVSRAILEELAAKHPERAGYQAELGQTYLALARRAAADGRAGAAAGWYEKAVLALSAAAAADPEVIEVQEALAKARAER